MTLQLAVIRSSLYSTSARYSDSASTPAAVFPVKWTSDTLAAAQLYSDGIVGDSHPASLNRMYSYEVHLYCTFFSVDCQQEKQLMIVTVCRNRHILNQKGGMPLSSQGSVLVKVYTSNAYIPLPGAPVIITQFDDDNKEIIIAVQFTDSSGITNPVAVNTPDPYVSQSPGAVRPPYALISIQAAYPGYQTIREDSVQIFPGVETIQTLQMLPVDPGSMRQISTTVQAPQNL